MALTWVCAAAFSAFTVPPQGHYSVYHVGSVKLTLYCRDDSRLAI